MKAARHSDERGNGMGAIGHGFEFRRGTGATEQFRTCLFRAEQARSLACCFVRSNHCDDSWKRPSTNARRQSQGSEVSPDHQGCFEHDHDWARNQVGNGSAHWLKFRRFSHSESPRSLRAGGSRRITGRFRPSHRGLGPSPRKMLIHPGQPRKADPAIHPYQLGNAPLSMNQLGQGARRG